MSLHQSLLLLTSAARARRGHRAARSRRARGATPTPTGIVTRAAACAHGGDGTTATGSSSPPACARIHS